MGIFVEIERLSFFFCSDVWVCLSAKLFLHTVLCLHDRQLNPLLLCLLWAKTSPGWIHVSKEVFQRPQLCSYLQIPSVLSLLLANRACQGYSRLMFDRCLKIVFDGFSYLAWNLQSFTFCWEVSCLLDKERKSHMKTFRGLREVRACWILQILQCRTFREFCFVKKT